MPNLLHLAQTKLRYEVLRSVRYFKLEEFEPFTQDIDSFILYLGLFYSVNLPSPCMEILTAIYHQA
jgi:hypothetical protein